MDYEILYRPSYSLLRVKLEGGEAISAEAGAMVSMSDTIEIETNFVLGYSRTAQERLMLRGCF